MIRAIVSDFSRVLLFPKDKTYVGSLNTLHKELTGNPAYTVLNHFELNTELLDFYKTLKGKVTLYIFTADVIQESSEFHPYLQHIFTKIFSATHMNTSKRDPQSYKDIAKELNLHSEEILFIDDSWDNVQAAKKAEIETIQYRDNKNVMADINKVLKA